MTLPHSLKLAGFKEYISQRDIRVSLPSWTATPREECHTPGRSTIQSWSNWAAQKIRGNTTEVTTVDEVHLFPGWATKQPHGPSPSEPELNTFDVVVHVSGFATSRKTPEFLTRSQRAFLRLARSFAAIPKHHPIPHPADTEIQDFAEHLHLPPRPCEISDDYDVETLDAQFRDSGNHTHEIDDTHFTPHPIPAEAIPAEWARLHENLESRLKLFWASSLSSRIIQVSIFLQSPISQYHRNSLEIQPLLTRDILTGPDGHFSGTFNINWNDICAHPGSTHITSSQTHVEHELLVEARITNAEHMPELHEIPASIMHIPITHSIVRVISDIDDTVKLSRVVDGARAIFNQVFVKDLEDTVIPEMAEWYGSMWERGARFHYVSNSPFELLPVIKQFISISNLPPGSIRLRSYAVRSLFNGLLSAPAARKRGNVVEVLDHFPDSQFILVGDSGEQDLELYSSLATERPGQIAGVFIRDVSSAGLDDPTGVKADMRLASSPMRLRKTTLPFPSSTPSRIVPKRASSDTDISPPRLGAIYIPQSPRKGSLPPTSFSFEPSPDSKLLSRVSEDSSSSLASTGSSVSSSPRSAHLARPITEGEKKRWDLQNRVNKARSLMPSHIMLRVFEHPKECVESEQIIRQLMDA